MIIKLYIPTVHVSDIYYDFLMISMKLKKTYIFAQHHVRFKSRMILIDIIILFSIHPSIFQFSTRPRIVIMF